MKVLNNGLTPSTGEQQTSTDRSLLGYCQACGNKVSKHAVNCPACGHPQYTPSSQPQTKAQKVSVTDVDMPFGSMVLFMIKWTIAAIPAAIVIIIIGTVLMTFIAGFMRHSSSIPSL